MYKISETQLLKIVRCFESLTEDLVISSENASKFDFSIDIKEANKIIKELNENYLKIEH